MKKTKLILVSGLMLTTLAGFSALSSNTVSASAINTNNTVSAQLITDPNVANYPLPQKDESIAIIDYVAGYGIQAFRSNGSAIPNSNKTFITGTKWNNLGSYIINGEEMFKVGSDQYIPRRYTNLTTKGWIYVNYTPNYGVQAFHRDGQPTGQYLPTGRIYMFDGAALINGRIMYKVIDDTGYVGSDTYIPKQFTQYGPGK